MSEIFNPDIKIHFGRQLTKYRNVSTLSLRSYAKYIKIPHTSVANAEKGVSSVGIEQMGKFADSFGVKYYNMANPDYAVPTFDKMPKALRDYVKQQKLKKKQAKEAQQQKEEQLVKSVIQSDFLHTARTAEEIAAKLKDKIEIKDTRVAAILRTPELKKLVKTISGSVKKYVLKGVGEGE